MLENKFSCLLLFTSVLEQSGTTFDSATSASTLDLLRTKYLIPPSTEPYNLNEPDNANPSMGQAQTVDYIFKGKVTSSTILGSLFVTLFVLRRFN